jgi:predicted Zn-dependent peptidase
MNSPYTMHTLANGLQIVIEVMPGVRSAAAGFLARTGARDETPPLAGVSHFLEHMMFKGTSQRTWRDITLEFDRMGSTYNAFTSEDRTFYYGWVRSEDIDRQIELLADMMRSQLPEEEFQTERKVILEEIAMSKDSLEHLAYDFIQERVFAGHPLAWPILGYDETVRNMDRDEMWAYFQRRYAPDNLMLIVAGHVDPAKIIALAERLCGHWTPSGQRQPRVAPKILGGVDSTTVDRFNQQVVALTFPSVGARHPLHETANAAATILGGDNSRFFWNIVQTGVSPRAGAYYVDLEDCGLFIVFGSCQPENVEKLLDAMKAESQRLTDGGVEPHEVDRVKNKRRTSLAVECEAPYYRLTQLMEDMDYHGRPRTVDEMLAAVDAVSADTISQYFREFPITAGGHLASVGPRKWPAA